MGMGVPIHMAVTDEHTLFQHLWQVFLRMWMKIHSLQSQEMESLHAGLRVALTAGGKHSVPWDRASSLAYNKQVQSKASVSAQRRAAAELASQTEAEHAHGAADAPRQVMTSAYITFSNELRTALAGTGSCKELQNGDVTWWTFVQEQWCLLSPEEQERRKSINRLEVRQQLRRRTVVASSQIVQRPQASQGGTNRHGAYTCDDGTYVPFSADVAQSALAGNSIDGLAKRWGKLVNVFATDRGIIPRVIATSKASKPPANPIAIAAVSKAIAALKAISKASKISFSEWVEELQILLCITVFGDADGGDGGDDGGDGGYGAADDPAQMFWLPARAYGRNTAGIPEDGILWLRFGEVSPGLACAHVAAHGSPDLTKRDRLVIRDSN